MSVSIELRWPDDDEIVCDWGVIEHTAPRPDRDEVGHLMVATRSMVEERLTDGPAWHHGALHSVAVDGDRIFAHIDYQGHRWTWELFEAHFADGKGPEIYIGRWPD